MNIAVRMIRVTLVILVHEVAGHNSGSLKGQELWQRIRQALNVNLSLMDCDVPDLSGFTRVVATGDMLFESRTVNLGQR